MSLVTFLIHKIPNQGNVFLKNRSHIWILSHSSYPEHCVNTPRYSVNLSLIKNAGSKLV